MGVRLTGNLLELDVAGGDLSEEEMLEILSNYHRKKRFYRLKSGDFVRSDSSFDFPYGFKHGTILEITEEEYNRMKQHNWSDIPDGRWA